MDIARDHDFTIYSNISYDFERKAAMLNAHANCLIFNFFNDDFHAIISNLHELMSDKKIIKYQFIFYTRFAYECQLSSIAARNSAHSRLESPDSGCSTRSPASIRRNTARIGAESVTAPSR